ncbi:hypothetical protein [Leptolyngbya sp. BL0902]|uniref:hypothetical protein n=1 Tax=Leptolyngbya sp. BL0902 TaxID=1115757 RepID=UPI0018E871CC|nr:hypothetical protein [Leptolyngbya sp. BL0902]
MNNDMMDNDRVSQSPMTREWQDVTGRSHHSLNPQQVLGFPSPNPTCAEAISGRSDQRTLHGYPSVMTTEAFPSGIKIILTYPKLTPQQPTLKQFFAVITSQSQKGIKGDLKVTIDT